MSTREFSEGWWEEWRERRERWRVRDAVNLLIREKSQFLELRGRRRNGEKEQENEPII